MEQLGLELQRLGRKAFPSTDRKDFDRLLKGRFFQGAATDQVAKKARSSQATRDFSRAL